MGRNGSVSMGRYWVLPSGEEFQKEAPYLSCKARILGWLYMRSEGIILFDSLGSRYYEMNGYYRFSPGTLLRVKNSRIVGYLTKQLWRVEGHTREGHYVLSLHGEETKEESYLIGCFKWNIEHHFSKAA